MREIKFRAWDKKLSKMFKLENCINFEISDLYDPRPQHEDLIVMQYTGLKDKNGKEIYEGDILHIIEVGMYGGEYNIELLWLNSWAIYGGNCIYVNTIKTDVSNTNVKDTTQTLGFISRRYGNCISLSDMLSFKVCEVIGNIYDNPKLINK